MDDRLAQLARDLQGNDIARRMAAAQGIAQLGEDAKSLAVALVRACEDDAETSREWVVAALESLGPPAQEDTRELASLLNHPCAEVGYWAATLLGRLGPNAVSAADELADSLERSDHLAVRQRAAWALGKLGLAASSTAASRAPMSRILASLQRAASSDDPRLARLARKAIGEIQQD